MNLRHYIFIGNSKNYSSESTDAVSAFHAIKKSDQNLYFDFRKYESGQLPPEGYSLLSIGYGLSVAYRMQDP